MLVQTALVEDDAKQASLLEEYLLSLKDDTYSFELSVFSSAEDFLSVFSPKSFQLLLLDIQLPRMDGLSAAKRVRAIDEDAVIVFITSAPQFAINGYEVGAKDYILKPLIYDHFARKMARILPHIKEKTDTLIAVGTGSSNLILADHLMFVEVFGHKLVYHCKDGDMEAYGKISDVEAQLKSCHFLRCNRNAVVNPRYIERMQDSLIKIGDHELAISAPRRKDFLRELNDYITR